MVSLNLSKIQMKEKGGQGHKKMHGQKFLMQLNSSQWWYQHIILNKNILHGLIKISIY